MSERTITTQAHGYPSTTVPPRNIGVGLAFRAKGKAKPVAPVTPTPPPPPQHPYPYAPYPYYAPPPPPPIATARYGDRYGDNAPSSDGLHEELDDQTLYPRISQWLTDIDNGVRGKDDPSHTQYGERLIQKGYKRIIDLENEVLVTPSGLERSCGIPEGVAVKLLVWARKDVKNIKDAEKRRLRALKNAPQRYE